MQKILKYNIEPLISYTPYPTEKIEIEIVLVSGSPLIDASFSTET